MWGCEGVKERVRYGFLSLGSGKAAREVEAAVRRQRKHIKQHVSEEALVDETKW